MKLTNLIWVLALAGAAAACNSGPPITNERTPTPPMGGNPGTGGITGDGACTDDADVAVYDGLTYISPEGNTFTGPDAASEMGSDCIFGAPTATPSLDGCGALSSAVILCFPNCDAATVQAAADCVALCVQDGTAEASPPGLSDACVKCTGDTVACGAASCTNLCSSDTNAPACIECRCANNCIQEFDTCSGLPSGNEC